MTINELDQGIRNLLSSQPMVQAGVNGEVITGINSLIDAYRNLSFRIQSYPCQDVMKFGLSNEISKIETTFTSLACQVLQERGINIMLYIPRTGAQYGPMAGGFGMINTAMDPNIMAGQMMYNAPMAGAPIMPMPNSMVGTGRPMAGAYPQMQPTMNGLGTPAYSAPRTVPTRHAAPTFPGYAPTDRPVKIEPAVQSEQIKTRVAQTKIKSEPKASSQVATINKTIPVAEPAPAFDAGMVGPQANAGAPSKSQGRDYLMELLKK